MDNNSLFNIGIKAKQENSIAKNKFLQALNKNKKVRDDLETIKRNSVYINAQVAIYIMPKLLEKDKEKLLFLQKIDAVLSSNLCKLNKKGKEELNCFIMHELQHITDDAVIKEVMAIEEKYNTEETKLIKETANNYLQELMFEEYGINVDVADFKNLTEEELSAKYGDQLNAFQENQDAQNKKKTTKKKTKKQLEKEAATNSEKDLLDKDIKQLYKELVLKLHPDKEMDESKKVSKTEILQDVNVAKENNDIYELLRIRIELLDTEIENSITYTDDVLKRLTKHLNQKNSFVENEIAYIKYTPPFSEITTIIHKDLEQLKKITTTKLNRELEAITNDTNVSKARLTFLEQEPKWLKTFLKDWYAHNMANNNMFHNFWDD